MKIRALSIATSHPISTWDTRFILWRLRCVSYRFWVSEFTSLFDVAAFRAIATFGWGFGFAFVWFTLRLFALDVHGRVRYLGCAGCIDALSSQLSVFCFTCFLSASFFFFLFPVSPKSNFTFKIYQYTHYSLLFLVHHQR